MSRTIPVSCVMILRCLLLLTLAASGHAAPSLWQIDSPEGKGRAYLFGSIHFGREDLYPLSDAVMQAFRGSQELMVELDLHRVDPAEASRILMEHGRYPIGVTLEEQLSAQQWRRLQAIAGDLGLEARQLQRLKPWLVAIQLAAAQVRSSGYSEQYGIDRYFIRLAKISSPPKPVLQLESFSEQMGLFDDLDHEAQLEFLSQTLHEFDRGGELLEVIIDAWRDGDEQDLNQAMKGAFQEDPDQALYRRLFSQRNQQMQASLQTEIDAGNVVFMVVGAGHIIGNDGIRALLQKAGYRAKRLQ